MLRAPAVVGAACTRRQLRELAAQLRPAHPHGMRHGVLVGSLRQGALPVKADCRVPVLLAPLLPPKLADDANSGHALQLHWLRALLACCFAFEF